MSFNSQLNNGNHRNNTIHPPATNPNLLNCYPPQESSNGSIPYGSYGTPTNHAPHHHLVEQSHYGYSNHQYNAFNAPPPSVVNSIPVQISSAPFPNPFSVPPPPIRSLPPPGWEERPRETSRRPYKESRGYHDYNRRSRSRSRSPLRSRGYSQRSRSPRDRDRRRVRERNTYSRSSRRPSNDLSLTSRSKSLVSKAYTYSDRDIDKHKEFLEKRAALTIEEIIQLEKKIWTRSAPADLYYERNLEISTLTTLSTQKNKDLCQEFENKILNVFSEARKQYPQYKPPNIRRHLKRCKGHKCGGTHGNCGQKKNQMSSSSSSSSSEDEDEPKNTSLEWIQHRRKQPYRLSDELWDNVVGEVNDGPTCRCSQKNQRIGIRHGIYQGEENNITLLDPFSNNFEKVFHYRVIVSPPTNFLSKNPTVIVHDGHNFVFEGFSLFTREPLKDLPVCKVMRFNIRYSIIYLKEKVPDNFTVKELELFQQYFFKELLDLHDWKFENYFYFMPRFVRDLSDDGKEILSMNQVLRYLLDSFIPLIDEMELDKLIKLTASDWLDFVDPVKGMLVTKPGMKPGSLRVDQLDREQDNVDYMKFPEIVHFGNRPVQMSYAGNSEYQKAWREFVKYRHLLANVGKPSYDQKRKLENMEQKLFEMRSNVKLKKDVTVAITSQGFYRTGLMADIVQHAMLLPVLINHLRFGRSLDFLEKRIDYTFKNRYLLQLAMTHPSHKENYGTTPDHARNTLSNCGIRQPQYGDKKSQAASTRKRGINMLINTMSKFAKNSETESNIQHNERLEFLGDAVVEFITSVHLFYMFPDLEEGGLATYRAALVQNFHLAKLAEALGLEKYMLYAHGSDLCHDSELRHAMANCFESLMGAIYLDGGIHEADRVFAEALFGTENDLQGVWVNIKTHPIQRQEPKGDRHWIEKYPLLQKLTKFEETVGIEFKNIRLLARAFTDRSLGISNLTLGSNQRMEFLGDTILQLITSDYLYKHFPDHHEGHLSLLRSSLVNNKTQSVVCTELGIPQFANFANPKHELKTKDRADLLEAFLGALYVDKDLDYCQKFVQICFFPRLKEFILNQEWNDPKSKLQQCCLTLRSMDGKDPDIPVYKVTATKGPTNTRIFVVAVYFRGKRLAKAQGSSIQDAQMNAARLALSNSDELFPHLDYQKKIVERSFHQQNLENSRQQWNEHFKKKRKELDEKYWNNKTSTDCEKQIKTKTLSMENKEVKKESNSPKEEGECSDLD